MKGYLRKQQAAIERFEVGIPALASEFGLHKAPGPLQGGCGEADPR